MCACVWSWLQSDPPDLGRVSVHAGKGDWHNKQLEVPNLTGSRRREHFPTLSRNCSLVEAQAEGAGPLSNAHMVQATAAHACTERKCQVEPPRTWVPGDTCGRGRQNGETGRGRRQEPRLRLVTREAEPPSGGSRSTQLGAARAESTSAQGSSRGGNRDHARTDGSAGQRRPAVGATPCRRRARGRCGSDPRARPTVPGIRYN